MQAPVEVRKADGREYPLAKMEFFAEEITNYFGVRLDLSECPPIHGLRRVSSVAEVCHEGKSMLLQVGYRRPPLVEIHEGYLLDMFSKINASRSKESQIAFNNILEHKDILTSMILDPNSTGIYRFQEEMSVVAYAREEYAAKHSPWVFFNAFKDQPSERIKPDFVLAYETPALKVKEDSSYFRDKLGFSWAGSLFDQPEYIYVDMGPDELPHIMADCQKARVGYSYHEFAAGARKDIRSETVFPYKKFTPEVGATSAVFELMADASSAEAMDFIRCYLRRSFKPADSS